MAEWENSLEKLRRELRGCGYPSSVDEKALANGDPGSLLPILHFALLSYSQPVARSLHQRGHALAAKSDLRFVEGVVRALSDLFSYRPSLLPGQMLSPGFAARKAQLAADTLGLCRKLHLQSVRSRSSNPRPRSHSERPSTSSHGSARLLRPSTAAVDNSQPSGTAVRSFSHSDGKSKDNNDDFEDEDAAPCVSASRDSSTSLENFFTRSHQPCPLQQAQLNHSELPAPELARFGGRDGDNAHSESTRRAQAAAPASFNGDHDASSDQIAQKAQLMHQPVKQQQQQQHELAEAGSEDGNITTQLEHEVEGLQLEVDELREQLAAAKQQNENQEAHIAVLESRVKVLEGNQHPSVPYNSHAVVQERQQKESTYEQMAAQSQGMSSEVKHLVESMSKKNEDTRALLNEE